VVLIPSAFDIASYAVGTLIGPERFAYNGRGFREQEITSINPKPLSVEFTLKDGDVLEWHGQYAVLKGQVPEITASTEDVEEDSNA